MGRIKTTLIKRNAKELVQRYRDKFTENFEDNKNLMASMVDMNSKKLRNVMAGYITRLMRQKEE